MQAILLAVFGAIVLVLLFVKEALDMAARIEYAEGAFPKLTKWAADKKWHRILLVSTLLFYGGTLYELLKEPPPPNIQWTDPRTSLVAPIIRENGELQKQIAVLTEKEPEDSLRRRTINLANKLDHYVQTRWDNHPSRLCEGPNIQQPTAEQTKALQECRRYDNETTNYINDNFKEKWIGIVREYEAKGVKVATLVNDMEQNHPAQNTFLPFWPSVNDGNYASAQSKFRELAYHVDARGNRIDLP
jgi:hypothetical protein